MKASSIDWNSVWKEMVQANQNTVRGNGNSIWDDRRNAERFWKRTQRNKSRIEKTLNELPVKPDHKVLDIGAGPGRLAIPLSERVAHVTAVEPGKGMLEILQENIDHYGINNIECINKRWEDLDVEKDLRGPYEMVIASFSLNMPDIKQSIEKMQAASSKYVFIYWFAGETPWEGHSKNLWPLLYGKEYTPPPKCNILYNVLYNMGIYPNMEVFFLEYHDSFTSKDEAADFFKSRYPVDTEEQEKLLKNYLERTLEEEDGCFVERKNTKRVKIWWDKEVIS